jgi:catecholate siderophore receptor
MHAPVAGALVAVTVTAAPVTSAQTGTDGRFSLSLAAGTYTVTVSAPGFADVAERITVREGQSPSLQFELPIAAVREAVTVTGTGGYRVPATSTATRTLTPLRDVPQAISVVTQELVKDQLMTSVADVMRYVPGVTTHQGENNRDQVIMRGNSSSADFFVDGVRDDVQYYRDLYNLDRVEVLKGPNALTFGRGGAGGVVNRVVKNASFMPRREIFLQGGEFGNKRFTADIDQPLTGTVALRVNGMFENSDSFRDSVDLERQAINPTLTFLPSDRTRVVVGYEYLRDWRVADRGITSYQGRPAAVPIETFFGDPEQSHVRADVNLGSFSVEHRIGRATIRNRTLVGDYGRFYQNFVPGAVTPDGAQVLLTAYNNATDRTNVFNQTDVTIVATTGPVHHMLLAGAEFGHQVTDNFRQSGFFNDTAATLLVPLVNPTTSVPVTFRQNATDADNHVRTLVGAAFVQDQVQLSSHVQLLGGLRFDRFDLRYHNNRNGDTLERPDDLVSPRAGVVVKPVEAVSLYGSYSVSYLPSSGDQFASLTVVTQQVEPEKFTNYEVGTKWDIAPSLSFTAAMYRLDRTNTRSTDPNDPTRIIQTGAQRTNGFETGLTGEVAPRWTVVAGYAYQDAYVRSATVSATAGAIVGQVPHHTFSLWNNYRVHPRLSAGLGLSQRSDMFATIDNTVMLPGYVRADAAAFLALTRQVRLQVNVENITGKTYYVNADSNTNISPGYPRSVRIALNTRF